MCWFYGEDKSARDSIKKWKMVKNSPGGRFGWIVYGKDYAETRAATEFFFLPAAMVGVACKSRQFWALKTKDN